MLTACQIRAARALLRLTMPELARLSGVAASTLQRMEKVEGVPATTVETCTRVRRALEALGVAFIADDGTPEGGPGLRYARPHPSRRVITSTVQRGAGDDRADLGGTLQRPRHRTHPAVMVPTDQPQPRGQ